MLLGQNEAPHRPRQDMVKQKTMLRRTQRETAANRPTSTEKELVEHETNQERCVDAEKPKLEETLKEEPLRVSKNNFEFIMNLHTPAPALTDGQVYAVTRAPARRRLCDQPFMFQSPFRLLLVGQPGAGKTNATACIVNNEYMCHRPSFIDLVRRHHQDIYDRMLQHDNFEVLDDFEDFDLDTAPDGSLLIIDDMGFQMAESRAFSDLLSSSGHRVLSIICLVPFLFDLG